MKKVKTNNISFVASTLPVDFIVKNNKRLDINIIYVPTKKLKRSLQFINTLIEKEIKVEVLPNKKMLQFLYILYLLFKSKIKQEKVIFFHEISWLIFDIAFHITKPCYEFFPQVKLYGWINIKEVNEDKSAKIQKIFLKFDSVLTFLSNFNIVPKFNLLFHPVDDFSTNKLRFYAGFSCQSYKSKKIENNISTISSKKKSQGKFIFLCGIDIGPKDEQREVTADIIKIIKDKGIKVELKGHPNWENIYPDNNDNKIIDKYIPFEILDSTEFIGIIGFGSIVLTRYPRKSISLLYFLESISSDLVERRVLSLKKIHKKNDCFYPKNKMELNKIIDLLIKIFYEE